jgi:hypothetical protein
MRHENGGIGESLRTELSGIDAAAGWLHLLRQVSGTAMPRVREFFLDPGGIEEACEGVERLGLRSGDFVFGCRNEQARVTRTSTVKSREYDLVPSNPWWANFLRDLQAGGFDGENIEPRARRVPGMMALALMIYFR